MTGFNRKALVQPNVHRPEARQNWLCKTGFKDASAYESLDPAHRQSRPALNDVLNKDSQFSFTKPSDDPFKDPS